MNQARQLRPQIDNKLSRRKFLSAMLFAGTGLALTSALSGCAKKEVVLTFWKAPHGEKPDFWPSQMEAFAKANPGIKAEYTATPWEGWTEKYTAAFAGESPPDVHYAVDEYMARFASVGQLQALDELDFAKADLEALRPHYLPNTWASGQYKGHLYGVPVITGNTAFVWNEDILQKAGFSGPPDTWEQLLEYGKEIIKMGIYGWAVSGIDVRTGQPWNVFYQAGCEILNEAGDGPGFDNEMGLAAAEFMYDMFVTYKIAAPTGLYRGRPAMEDAFLNGKIAMCETHSGIVAKSKEYPGLKMGVGPSPAGPGKKHPRGVYAGVGYWSMATKSKHKEEAWKLIKFLSTPELHKALLEPIGLGSPRNDVKLFENDPLMAKWVQNIENAVFYPIHPQLGPVLDSLYPEFEALTTGQKKPDQFIKDAAAAVRAALKA